MALLIDCHHCTNLPFKMVYDRFQPWRRGIRNTVFECFVSVIPEYFYFQFYHFYSSLAPLRLDFFLALAMISFNSGSAIMAATSAMTGA